jgi:hypothetical protein
MSIQQTLGEKQREFAIDVANFIVWIYSQGYAVTMGEAYRTPEQAYLNQQQGRGISNSLHTQRLAIDLNLFINDIYQTDSEAYYALGVYWEGMRDGNAWGGRFKRADGNHFSRSHEGRR